MKFPAFFIVIALMTQFAQAQRVNIQGCVVDDSLRSMVPYVSIYLYNNRERNFVSAVSDLNGMFSLVIPIRYADDTIHFSSVGYETVNILARRLTDEQNIKIRMKQKITQLPAVAVHALSAGQLILRSLQKVEENYGRVSFLNHGSFWQSVREDSTYKNLATGRLIIREDVNKENMIRTISRDSVVSAPLASLTLFDSVENAFYVDFVRLASGVANLENNKEWKFSYDHEDALPKDYSRVNAVRLDHVVSASVLINERDDAVENVDYTYHWKKKTFHLINDTLAYVPRQMKGMVIYRKVQRKYTLQYLFISCAYDVYRQHGYRNYKRKYVREVNTEIIVNDCVENNLNRNEKDFLDNHSKSSDVINVALFCEAANALHISSHYCK